MSDPKQNTSYCYMMMPGYYRGAETKNGKFTEHSFTSREQLEIWLATKRKEGESNE
jgi:hypothetical protein